MSTNSSLARVKLEKLNYGGWPNCLKLSNGRLELVATTDVGPRVIRLGFVGGDNLFKEWPDQLGKSGGEEWRIYGGHRLWHAPEAQPRTYAPDNQPIAHTWDGAALQLTQPVEPTTGLQKEIELRLDAWDARVRVVHRLTNRNLWTVELAPWALTVFRGPGRAIFPQEPPRPHGEALLPARPLVLWAYTDMSDPRWSWGRSYLQLRSDPARQTPQKVGLWNTPGWAAFARERLVFVKTCRVERRATYPDFGCTMETYTNGDMIEVESLGPLTNLEPGASVGHLETWHLFEVDLGQDEAALDAQLLPLLEKAGVLKANQ
jgi:hypothetical protein